MSKKSTNNFSDHNAISIVVDYQKLNGIDPFIEQKSYDALKIKLNWLSLEQRLEYQNNVQNNIAPLYSRVIELSNEDDKNKIKCKLSETVNELTSILVNAAINTSSLIKKTKKMHIKKKSWWNSIYQEIHIEMVSKYIKFRNSGFSFKEKLEYFSIIKQFRKQKRLNLKLKKEGLLKKLNALLKKNKIDFWKEINKQYKKCPRVDIDISALEDEFKLTFSKTNNVSMASANEIEKAEKDVIDFIKRENSTRIEYNINFEKLDKKIKNLSNNKSVGLTLLSNEMLKYSCNSTITETIKVVFEKMIETQTMPYLFNLSIVRPLIKCSKKRNSDLKNIRPIAVSEPLSNLFEQFGFKKKSSCGHAVFCLKQAIKLTKKKRQAIYVCAIDASKAFDKVIRAILWQQLIKNKISVQVTLALIKYYESSLMMVSNHGLYSNIFKSTVGVRQGGVASPKLFSIYLEPILKKLAECDEGIKVGDIKLDILAYADDILLMNTTKNGLQKQLEIIEEIGMKMDIKFNPTKTVFMKFNN
ncbi:RNA-directed DNA polymerase from mobile element jockey-like, partial [Brachionus plicatilis]